MEPKRQFDTAPPAELARLEKHLRGASGEGYRLFLLEWDEASDRAEIIQRLGDGFPSSGQLTLTVESPADFSVLQHELAALAKVHPIIHVLGFENWHPKRPDTFELLNYGRERLAAICPVALLFWLTPPDMRRLATEAPDLWAWRTAVIDLTEKTTRHRTATARLAEIEAYLAQNTGSDLDLEMLKREASELWVSLRQDPAEANSPVAVVEPDQPPLLVAGHPFGDGKASGLLRRYLRGLIADCQKLKLDVIDQKTATDSQSPMGLSKVYTQLMVSAMDPRDAMLLEPREERKPMSATTFASAHRKAVILGKPGAGKTTFTDHLSLCLAGEILGDAEVNLAVLGQDWQGGVLLPLRVTLREYAARSLPKDRSLWDHLALGWTGSLKGLADPMRAFLLKHGGLLALDGLDEVPEASGCRDRVKAAVLAFQEQFPLVRLLVTCRTYAYVRQQWQLPGFEAAELAPFGPEQWNAFVSNWYQELSLIRGRPDKQTAPIKAKELQEAIASWPHLQELAASPLLLTLMASLHSLRGGTLPKERERLYEESMGLLLDTWERPKTSYGEEEKPVLTASFQEFLKLPNRKVLEDAMAKLAYEVHAGQGHKPGTADISESQLLVALAAIATDRLNPSLLAEYVRDRAGLLTHNAEGVYSFPHRTFQEYLAARHLCDLGSREIARHLSENPGLWREAYLLAGAKAARGMKEMVWTIVQKTCPKVPEPNAPVNTWLCAALAGQMLVETGATAIDGDEKAIRQTIVDSLVAIVDGGRLDPVERARAGATLAQLGDPRPGVGLRVDGVPDIVWQEVPAGDFHYGDERKKQSIAQTYSISRYPITVAQYEAFMRDGGYANDEWWANKDGLQWRTKNHIEHPETYSSAFITPNHPQVGVSYYEAEAFCRWLSAKLKQQVRIPTEQEWERAARGTDGRKYPWEDVAKAVEAHANIAATGIGHTSPVGMFPTGKSPAGCLDMAGNVWEWTRGSKDACVVRGGSFNLIADRARCAYRYVYYPNLRFSSIGFRVVLSPF